ncbi:hypothetical protein PIB30_057774 [Stylosanthes scabra]|uniref:Uncharacterized protein n=1 Tax=Stylosanthes scabra TaxID=79078 RepID=A0ABU6RKL3_9FABA|nr:hypothetical protein [Stylosanthes scabra]
MVNVMSSSPSEGENFKKGPWTSEEDEILADYVKKHGAKNWEAVQTNSGLKRSGKSCRLRWTNHLNPSLKKGVLTPQEIHKIIQLHRSYGNKRRVRAYDEHRNARNANSISKSSLGIPVHPHSIIHSNGSTRTRMILQPQQQQYHPQYHGGVYKKLCEEIIIKQVIIVMVLHNNLAYQCTLGTSTVLPHSSNIHIKVELSMYHRRGHHWRDHHH